MKPIAMILNILLIAIGVYFLSKNGLPRRGDQIALVSLLFSAPIFSLVAFIDAKQSNQN